MGLLWNFFRAMIAFSLFSVAIAAVLAYHKRIYEVFLDYVEKRKNDFKEKGVFLIIQAEEQKIIDSIRKNWTISSVIIVILLVLLFLNPDVKSVFPWVEPGKKEPKWTPNGEFVARIVTPLFAFIVSLLLIYRTFKQFRLQSEQLKRQAENTQKQLEQMERQEKNAQKQMAAEQFKNAITHLGDEKQSVVLGGVHALHNLAVNFDEYREQVFEVLCGFIREETSTEKYRQRPSEKPSIVIQTIVDKLFLNEKSSAFYKKYAANLSGAFLCGVNFANARFNVNANFSDTNLQNAILTDAKLHGANFTDANLQRVIFTGAYLYGTNLIRANMQEAMLWKANLQNADLTDAKLHGANLRKAEMRRAILKRADFRGVQSRHGYSRAIEQAVIDGTGLETDMSGITLYDSKENEYKLSENRKKAWFRECGANVEDLSAEEVRQLAKDLGIIKEEDEPQQPDDEPISDEPTDSTDTQ